MLENLGASHNLFFSQRLLLALVESGLGRDEAYRQVQRLAQRAWDEVLDFCALVRADPAVAGRVDLDAVFDLGVYARHVDVVFERLHELVASRGEAVHV
jgi:adenylosuccinate lyase